MLESMKRWLSRLREWCNNHEWLLLLVILVTVLRLPTFFTPHYYGDEEIYFVMGRAWSEGVPMYQNMFDHKPPLIYVLAGLAQNVFWFRMMLYGSMLLHTVLFWKLARKFFAGRARYLAYVSSMIFVLLTSLPLLEGNIANAELFMMLPVTASLLMIWSLNPERKLTTWLAAGLVAGLGWLFKVPVALDAAAIALYFFIFRPTTLGGSLRALLKPSLWLYLLGFALPLALTFVYYELKGHGVSYLDTVLTINLGYVSSWSTSQFSFNPLASGLLSRGMILLGFTLLLYLLRRKLDKRLTFAALWFGFSFFGSLLSGRPYPHYLQEPTVPFSLLVPLIFVVDNVASWVVIGYLSFWGILTNGQIRFWGYPSVPLYKNFVAYATGKISKQEYFETFDGARRNYILATFLNERMEEEDQLYIWGSDAAVYNLTNKLPAGGKYIVNFHVHDFRQHDYVVANLEVNKPKYIVILPNTTDFPQLEELLINEYIEVTTVEGARVYRHTGKVL